MTNARRAALPLALLLLMPGLSGCGGEREDPEVAPAESPGAMDGLTRDQIREQVEPMSPARAESLGIVDTTIHVEDPYPGVDVPDPGAPPTRPAPPGRPPEP